MSNPINLHRVNILVKLSDPTSRKHLIPFLHAHEMHTRLRVICHPVSDGFVVGLDHFAAGFIRDFEKRA